WGRYPRGSRCRLTALSPARTMAPAHRWAKAASGSSRGTPAAIPNTGCRVPRWCSRSRGRAPRCFGRRT
ncbi:MAG: Dihydrofolate reductase, partial [uncultured Rubrobacteraceae bacterium]